MFYSHSQMLQCDIYQRNHNYKIESIFWHIQQMYQFTKTRLPSVQQNETVDGCG